MKLKNVITLYLFLIVCMLLPRAGEAASYSYYLGEIYRDYGQNLIYPVSINIIGYNITQGVTMPVSATVSYPYSNNYYNVYLDYDLPDDGSTYIVRGTVVMGIIYDKGYGGEYYYGREFSIDITKTTSGTFTGVSIRQAVNAANNAAANASSALTAANAAKTSADAAKTEAINAKNAANIAANNTSYSGQSAAYWAYQAAQGGVDITSPTIQKVQGLNGATCTTTGTFYVVVQATDNRAGQLQAHAQVDGGAWTGWYNIPQNAIPVTLSSTGAHTITVEVKDAAGNSSQATMTAFRV